MENLTKTKHDKIPNRSHMTHLNEPGQILFGALHHCHTRASLKVNECMNAFGKAVKADIMQSLRSGWMHAHYLWNCPYFNNTTGLPMWS